MARKHTPIAICYDFDGTLSPGYMQNYNFIPELRIKTDDFWTEVKKITKEQQADEILIYMGQMLRKAVGTDTKVTKDAFAKIGARVELFAGVEDWFERINEYARAKEIAVEHYIISSGLREMIKGTKISKYFKEIYASGFWYDQHDVAIFPAIAVNYTTKTQYLFRINKGTHDLSDKEKVNSYTAPDDRVIPFKNMLFIGDGDTDIPCFRLVKDLGGHSIAVYKPRSKSGGKAVAEKLIKQGRVNFAVAANYSEGSEIDQTIKAIIDKLAANAVLKRLGKQE